MEENSIALPPERKATEMTEVHVSEHGQYRGCMYLTSRLRHGAAETVQEISGLGLKTYLLTGDHRLSAETIADLAGIDQFQANMNPKDKTRWVQEKLDSGGYVLMVGDGVNDAPALSAASVGCAMSGGTDVALETSDLVLMRNDLVQIPEAINLARKTLSIIRQNLFWAFTYNLIAIPLAASGHLAPVYAAAAMAGSSLCVVANSLRLKAFRFDIQSRPSLTDSTLGEEHA